MTDTIGLLSVGYLLLDRAGIAHMSDWGSFWCWLAVIVTSCGAVNVRLKD